MKSELPAVLHVITGTGVGGAERMLQKLVIASESTLLRNEVVSLTEVGEVGLELQQAGVPVHALHMRRALPSPWIPRRIRKIADAMKADLIQTWMYHADLLGGLGAGKRPVVWGIRQSRLDPDATRRSTLWVARLCARLSRRVPQRILCNSQASVESHAAFGYDRSKMAVIPNGFDTERFRPRSEARAALHATLGLPQGAHIVGTVTRFDAAKDIPNALAAAASLAKQDDSVHFVFLGRGMDPQNQQLQELAVQHGFSEGSTLRRRLHMLGVRPDLDEIIPGLDLFFLASLGEGFPNALGEAMSCAIPCVSTNAGDCAAIGGGLVPIVPTRDPAALSQQMAQLLRLSADEARALGAQLRQRIIELYSLQATTASFVNLYQEVMASCAE